MPEATVEMEPGSTARIILRPATAADIPAIRWVEEHSATTAHWSEAVYERLFRPGGLPRLALVLEQESKVVGFVVALCIGAEWEIENIAVSANMRRRGLSSRLLGELLERARAAGAEGVFLEVRESNLPARFLYEKWDFTQSGRRKAYYSDPNEDAVVYHLHLS